MKIAIDVSQITADKAGIEYYTHELTKALIAIEDSNTLILLSNKQEYLDQYPNKQNVRKVLISQTRPNLIWMIRTAFWSRVKGIDLLISPSYLTFSLLFPKTIQIVHDLTLITNPEYFNKSVANKFKSQMSFAVKYSKHLVTNSYTTQNILNKMYPKSISKTSYIGMGLNEWIFKKTTEYSLDLPEKYVLSLSTLQPRKNYINMIKAFSIFVKQKPEYKYIIVGKKGWYFEEIFNIVKKLKLEDKVIFWGYAQEEDLPELIEKASVLLYCSLEEGFGMPAIEAYAKGLPVVVSDIPVFHEAMEDKAYFANPNNPDDISNQILITIDSKPQIDNAFLSKYRWENVAKRLQSVYATVT